MEKSYYNIYKQYSSYNQRHTSFKLKDYRSNREIKAVRSERKWYISRHCDLSSLVTASGMVSGHGPLRPRKAPKVCQSCHFLRMGRGIFKKEMVLFSPKGRKKDAQE